MGDNRALLKLIGRGLYIPKKDRLTPQEEDELFRAAQESQAEEDELFRAAQESQAQERLSCRDPGAPQRWYETSEGAELLKPIPELPPLPKDPWWLRFLKWVARA